MNAHIRNDGDWVGASVNRKEDRRLTTGQGQYFADKKIPGTLHLVFVRSQQAHARIVSINTAAARALKGVVAVVTGEEIRTQIKGLPQPVVVPSFAANYPAFWPLAVDKVKFHGEPVAAVIARDRYLAEDAAALVEIVYDPLPVVTDMEAALAEGAPIVHDGWASNEMFAMNYTGGGTPEGEAAHARKVDEALAAAAVVIRRRFRVHRCGVTPLEPRGAMATWDDDGLTAWITTQRPHIDRLALSDVLEIPSDKVRVIAPRDQGGAFGVKAPFYREPILVCHIARVLGRPVRWLETREEHLMSVSQERDQIHDIEIGADANGRIVALRDNAIADNGDGCEGVYWGFVMPFFGAAVLTNAYDIPLCDIRIKVVCTNKAVLSPARSFGAFAARFALDRAIDLLARELKIDPADVRRRNLITELPYTTATGVHHDSGDYVKVFDHLTSLVDLKGFRAEQARSRAEGRHIGIGFSVGAELSGVSSAVLVSMENQPGFGAATVRVDPRGKVQVFEGDAPQGQGHETSMAQVVAQEFGIHPGDVSLTTGDTGTTPFGSGTIGARGGSYTVSAVANACRALKTKMATVLLHDLKVEGVPSDVSFRDGRVFLTADPTQGKNFAALAERIVMAPLGLPAGMQAGLDQTEFFEADVPMLTFGAHAAIVEVDPETGIFKILRYVASDDFGTVINPIVVAGQVHGGVVQGPVSYTHLTLPTNYVYKRQHTPLGSRGLGEGIPGPVPAALTNAVCDALAPFGIELNRLPLRPNMIWRLLQDKAASRG
ncbi:xanthine dehydrogenase family protein molybdopterin-binding subunit [Bradyrhizobium sp. UFLA06-06]